MIRLIVSDVDGTLVGDGQGEGSLNPEYYRVIHGLVERGIRFLACSGRQRLSIAKLFRPIEDEIYYACDGGSIVFDKEKALCVRAMDRNLVNALIRDVERIPACDVMVCGTECAYCRSEDSELYRWMTSGYGYDIRAVGDLTRNVKDEIVKVSVYHHNRVEELTNPWFRPKWEDKVKMTLAGIQWLDCVPKDAGKAGAVAFIQNYFHIQPSETIVFGDNQNDMEMFSLAEKSYAVSNAREEVKQAATCVCEEYFKDGVLKVLKNI